jgi:hypothetical protein
MEGIFTTGKAHNIFLMISLTVLTFTSLIALPSQAEAAKSLSELENERNVNPEIFLGRAPYDIVVDDDVTIYVRWEPSSWYGR